RFPRSKFIVQTVKQLFEKSGQFPMSRKPHALNIEENGGEIYATLTEVQDATMSSLATEIVANLRVLYAKGIMINQDGKMIPNPQNSTLETKE
ncbi:MAG TPA: hypothetical protein PK530_15250, partial [Anaerolineales bacterium]|nr:hypothetical protein [Anaerolineales bacterium]